MRGKHVHTLLGFACGWIASTLFVTFTSSPQGALELAGVDEPVGAGLVHTEHKHAPERRLELEPEAERPLVNPYPADKVYMPPGKSAPTPPGNGRRVLIEIGARDGDSLWSLIRPHSKEKLRATPKERWGTSDVLEERNFDVMFIIEADPEFNPYWEKLLTTGRYFNNTPMPETYFFNKAVWVEDSHLEFELRGTGSRIVTEKDKQAAQKVDPGHGRKGSGTGIKVLESSLGMNCELPGYDTTKDLAAACDGKQWCRYRVDMWKLGGDIDGCHWRKIFKARYVCDDDNFKQEVLLESKVEGDTKNIQLSCGGLLSMRIEAMNFDKWLRYYLRPDDYVVMKIDIEGAEIPVLNKLIDTRGVQLIDEMLYECHYHELTWQNPEVPVQMCRRQCEQMVEQGVKFWFWARREVNKAVAMENLRTHETDAWWIKYGVEPNDCLSLEHKFEPLPEFADLRVLGI
ncbi:hypothetical protein KFE25_005836 [Diacronema lutheri]|uniref:DUF7870 domain-containing protein n=2 Tax=Diacronema lutheri TaxID=2081491 RepID=A0A8J5XUT4_DIALT|nr:hypothetical protein KFE25_005836 [Diacronema lutheri]